MRDIPLRHRRALAALCSAALLAGACVPPPARPRAPAAVPPPAAAVRPPSPAPAPTAPLRLVPPEQWPRFHDGLGTKGLAQAASRSSAYLRKLESTRTFYRVGDREVAPGELSATAEGLVRAMQESQDEAELDARLKREFDLYQSAGSDGSGKVVFSSYYQPVIPASLKKTAKFKYPIYRKPKDLVAADLALFGKSNGDPLLGRVTKDGRLVPYFSRRDIDVRKALAGKGLEIAWLDDPFDRLDLHIQGSGMLKFAGGKTLLAKYAATNSLPYRSVGTVVVGAGAMSKSDITRERLNQYLKDHPEGVDWILSQNPRYTFFELVPLPGDGEPFGTIEEPLTAGRSIAVDPKVIPLGAVAYFETNMPQADDKGRLLGIFPASRFAMCQDTGGAIQGPGRVDIYTGHGAQAKAMAVNQWAEGRLFLLLKKLPPRDR